MKISNKSIIIIAVLILLQLTSYAQISDININVVKQIGETKITEYTGLLSGYDAGRWMNIDFNQKDFAVIFDWYEDDITYIYPATNNTDTMYNSNRLSLSGQNTLLNTAQTSLSSDSDIYYSSMIKINGVNVGENGLRIVNNADFEYSVELENRCIQTKTLSLILATYTSDNNLYSAKNISIDINSLSEGNISLIYKFNAGYEKSAKLMLWDMTSGIIPVTAALSFDGNSGINAYYYNSDNRLMQVDKSNGVSILYTYDKMGNLLTKAIRGEE